MRPGVAGYKVSQQKRTKIEEVFGWLKTVASLRKTRHRGVLKVGWVFRRRSLAPQQKGPRDYWTGKLHFALWNPCRYQLEARHSGSYRLKECGGKKIAMAKES